MNHFEEASRAVKIAGLVRAMDSFGEYRGRAVTAAELLEWSDRSWHLIAHAAKVNIPSSTTRGLVLLELANRESAALDEVCPECGSPPDNDVGYQCEGDHT